MLTSTNQFALMCICQFIYTPAPCSYMYNISTSTGLYITHRDDALHIFGGGVMMHYTFVVGSDDALHICGGGVMMHYTFVVGIDVALHICSGV